MPETRRQAAAPDDPSTPPLHRALDQSAKVTEKVEEAAQELAHVNDALQHEVSSGVPVEQVQRTIEKSEAVETKVQEAADELVEVTTALAMEVDERDAIQSALARSQSAEAASRHRALHDTVTGLPNATLFGDRLDLALEQSLRHGWRLAVMFVDLDRFKAVNDTYGHDVGDRVLQATAIRLSAFVRGGDSVARRGGDEFLVLLLEVQGDRSALAFGASLIDCIAEPCVIDDTIVSVGASIGIAIYPEDGESAELLLKRADAAMYVAKGSPSGVARHASADVA